MHTYEILLNHSPGNDYIRGRISGVVYVLSGRPKREYAWIWDCELDWTWMFEASEEQANVIQECLNKMYPNTFVGMRQVE